MKKEILLLLFCFICSYALLPENITATCLIPPSNPSYDYNNDNIIDIYDVNSLLQVSIELSNCQSNKICDLNNDGIIDISDVNLLQNWIYSNNCPLLNCSDNQTIMKVSNITNAYAEIWNETENYLYPICYQNIFGVNYPEQNSHECIKNNKVIGLSLTKNALAEIPSLNNYPVNVCYGDLECNSTNQSCDSLGTNYKEIIRLSKETNALLEIPINFSSFILEIKGTSKENISHVKNYEKTIILTDKIENKTMIVQTDTYVNIMEPPSNYLSYFPYRQTTKTFQANKGDNVSIKVLYKQQLSSNIIITYGIYKNDINIYNVTQIRTPNKVGLAAVYREDKREYSEKIKESKEIRKEYAEKEIKKFGKIPDSVISESLMDNFVGYSYSGSKDVNNFVTISSANIYIDNNTKAIKLFQKASTIAICGMVRMCISTPNGLCNSSYQSNYMFLHHLYYVNYNETGDYIIPNNFGCKGYYYNKSRGDLYLPSLDKSMVRIGEMRIDNPPIGNQTIIVQVAGTSDVYLRGGEIYLEKNSNLSQEFIVSSNNPFVNVYFSDTKENKTTNIASDILGKLLLYNTFPIKICCKSLIAENIPYHQTEEPNQTEFGCNVSENHPYDYNDDKVIDASDTGFLLKVALELNNCPSNKICDLNNDGTIDISDVTLLVRYITVDNCNITIPQIPKGIAYWADMNQNYINKTNVNDSVLMIYNIGEEYNGQEINFEVHEVDKGLFDVDCSGDWPNEARYAKANVINGKAIALWKARYCSNGESDGVYFIAKLNDTIKNESDILEILSYNNEKPYIKILSPENEDKFLVNNDISFNLFYKDVDDELEITWNFNNENTTTLTNCLNNNCNIIKHSFNTPGVKIIKVRAKEKNREQYSEDAISLYIYKEGINVFAVISKPDPKKEIIIQNITKVEFDGSSSYVSNCTKCENNICINCPSNKECYNVTSNTEILQCFDLPKPQPINSPLQGYNLWFNWTILREDNNLYGNIYGDWNENYYSSVNFNHTFRQSGKYKAKLKVGYEPL
ncbi:MAG: hypothetical protein QW117_02300 [Candidatus Pacearchaeota archaeon]